MIRRDLEPKPALAAIAGSAASSHGMKLLVKSKGTPQVFLMKSAKGFGAVVYGAGLSLPEDVKAFDLWGNPITDGNLGNGDTPVYLAGPGVMKLMGR